MIIVKESMFNHNLRLKRGCRSNDRNYVLDGQNWLNGETESLQGLAGQGLELIGARRLYRIIKEKIAAQVKLTSFAGEIVGSYVAQICQFKTGIQEYLLMVLPRTVSDGRYPRIDNVLSLGAKKARRLNEQKM